MKLSKVEQALAGQVSAERLWEYTLNIARKVRLSGSPDEAESFRYIARALKGWGLEIEEHRPECWTSWPGAALLEILGDAPESIPGITHAMAVSTPPDGVVLDLVNAGPADVVALDRQPVHGRAAVCEGLAMPAKVFRVEAAGAAAQIHICGEHLHEMITSVVWGSPTPETAHLLPKTPIVSVTKQEGAKLHEAMHRGRARVRIRAQVDTAWRPLPILIAHLRAPKSHGDFLLFSGHVDSWHYGAMDNASANATQLEVARILTGRRRRLRRDLRLAFWSGHSHGRYAGSAWYADHFWQDLHDHCILHLNVDSVGGKGASLLSQAIVMAEVRDFASVILEKVAGQRLSGARPQRAGDQSFWGHGVPSLFMTLSEQPLDDSETARAFAQLMGGSAKSGGLGWWWHTTEDTLDKLDPALMVRDAQIYLLVTQRLLEDLILPLDYRAVVKEAREILTGYVREAKGRFDLGPALRELEGLAKGLNALYRIIEKEKLTPSIANRVNRCLMAVGRELIPINYTRSGPFDHDTTLAVPPYPGLEPMRRLATLPPKGDEARQLCVALVRQQNKVSYHYRRAAAEVEATVAGLTRKR
ncbi:MAG TPA: M28 family peptidase [Candidatus Methylomirabilis sp.]|nr:M28 family peptidase [Candidatus Methylomirabilis sp.]